jgi:hypothetical protein
MWFMESSASCSDLQKDAGAHSNAIAQPTNRRKCPGEFETDVDSFDIAAPLRKRSLKTNGIIHRGFGIPIALPHFEHQRDIRNDEMRKTTKVLSIGLEEWRNAVCKALPQRRKNGYWGVNNLWDLCALPEVVTADVAVFHHSFSPHDLRYAAEYVRRRWPDAVILVIGEQAKQLDDPLYDDKTNGEISIEELVRTIEKSVAAKRGTRRKVQFGLGNARR